LSSTFQCIILNLQAKASVFSSSELSEVLYFASMTPDQLASFIMNFDDYHLCVSPWRRDPDGKLSSSPQERLDLRSGMWSIVDGFGIDEHGVAEDDFQVLVHAAQWRNKAFFSGSGELVSPLMVVARSLYDAKLKVLQSCQEDADDDD
jgi:hypothetical protein